MVNCPGKEQDDRPHGCSAEQGRAGRVSPAGLDQSDAHGRQCGEHDQADRDETSITSPSSDARSTQRHWHAKALRTGQQQDGVDQVAQEPD
jgi:hypothetical protein